MDKEDRGLQTEYFDCECKSLSHTLRFSYFAPYKRKDGIDEPAEVYAEVQLNQYHNFWQRLVLAVRYLFKCNCAYGYFDTWILSWKDCERLRDFANKMVQFKKMTEYKKN